MLKKQPIFYISLSFIFCVFLANRVIILSSNKKIFSTVTELNSADYILVLGASKNGRNGLNPYFKKRMDATIELYNSGKAPKIIVSGENSSPDYNEPRDMTNYLVSHGIPSSDIIQDYAGLRTLDSVVRAQKVFNVNSVIFVSQSFHLQRALYIADYIQLTAQGFTAADVNSNLNFTHFREIFAKTLVIIDLYLLKTSPKFY